MRKNPFLLLTLILCLLLSSCESKSQQNSNLVGNPAESNFDFKVSKLYSVQNKNKKPDLKILTWNIQNLGQSKDSLEIHQIALIIKDFDVVAIQEVVAIDPRGAQSVAKISDELNRMGSKWDFNISDPTKSPTNYMSERYAFIWKTSKLKLLEKPHLDKKLDSVIIREPYIGKFKLKNNDSPFYLVNVHSRVHDENPEDEIVFFEEYSSRLATENIFILGDFNLDENHMVWDNLYEIGFKSSIQNAPTTLKRKCKNGGYLSHSIDNIYYNTSTIELVNSGRLDFVNNCENLKSARLISDHLPVFLECKIQ